MQRGKASIDVWNTFDRMFLTIGTIEPDTPRRVALLPEIWARTNELLKQRRSRLAGLKACATTGLRRRL